MLFRLWDHRLSGQCFLVQILQHRVRLAKQKIHIEHTIIIIGMRTRDLNYARMTFLDFGAGARRRRWRPM